MNKGSEFLKKMWCCIGGRVQQGNLVSSIELIVVSSIELIVVSSIELIVGHCKEVKG